MGRPDNRHALNDKSRNGTKESSQYLKNPVEPHKSKPKRTISTSRIFEKQLAGPLFIGKSEAPKQGGGAHVYHGVHKPRKPLGRKDHHTNKAKVMSKKKEEHPLYHALIENDHEYCSQVRSDVDASIEASHNALTERLAASLNSTREAVPSHQDLKEDLFRPLGSEQLALNTTINGVTHTDKVHLGQRVENFRSLTANKKKELDGLWKEWTAVQKQIVALGVEVLGPESFDTEGYTTAGKAEDVLSAGTSKSLGTIHEASKVEFDRMIRGLEEEVSAIGNRTLERLEASEKELKFQQTKKQREILLAMFS